MRIMYKLEYPLSMLYFACRSLMLNLPYPNYLPLSISPSWFGLIVAVCVLKMNPRCRNFFATRVVRPTVTSVFDLAYRKTRKETLQALNGVVSYDDELNEADTIRVLELGIGTGANFKYIHRAIRLVAVEPNLALQKSMLKALEAFPNIVLEGVLGAFGENMVMVPSESVDAVVITHVLCSVTDVGQVLFEIKRVLVPGGKLIFMEHVAYPDHTCAFTIQKALEPIAYLISCPCDMRRRSDAAILEAGFACVSMREAYIPVLSTFQRHIYGVATKDTR
ncbi:thiol S-methyltransferase TMT1A-like [Ornithodoros turicata]|uniref:thiol S-methyltransferase TMT1A-like n=1 Tax=Ornithodoros turicata TaxID=34597 RepID=UPI0031394DDD